MDRVLLGGGTASINAVPPPKTRRRPTRWATKYFKSGKPRQCGLMNRESPKRHDEPSRQLRTTNRTSLKKSRNDLSNLESTKGGPRVTQRRCGRSFGYLRYLRRRSRSKTYTPRCNKNLRCRSRPNIYGSHATYGHNYRS